MPARPFVLVHGAWHGGWCWNRVADILRAAGHKVVAPTLDFPSPRIGLETLIEDVTSVIEDCDLADIVLVGHSFGGVVTACVADRLQSRVATLVYLDAVIPRDGFSVFDLVDSALVASRRILARKHGGMLPVPTAASFGVHDLARANWLTARLTPQPIQPYEDKVALSSSDIHRETIYIACIDPLYLPMAPFRAWARGREGWTFYEIATGHDAMVIAPELVAAELLRWGCVSFEAVRAFKAALRKNRAS